VEARFGERRVGRRRHAVAAQEILRVSLRALQPRRALARAEATQPGALERVDDAEHERRFGAYDREIDALALRKADQPVDVVCAQLHVADVRLERRASIAGRDVHRAHTRRLRRFPRERVLAAAGTDDENSHKPSAVVDLKRIADSQRTTEISELCGASY